MQPFFQAKAKQPMTAAERQRKCRANGKGRHRGRRPTRADLKAYLAQAEPVIETPLPSLPPFECNLSAMAA